MIQAPHILGHVVALSPLCVPAVRQLDAPGTNLELPWTVYNHVHCKIQVKIAVEN